MSKPLRLAFIGLGHMGSHMCRHVCTAGHQVSAFDSDSKALARAVASGAHGATSMADCIDGAEVLVTSLPGPPQVDEVLAGADGAIAALAPGSLVIDTSTSSLEVGRKVLAAARARRIEFVDAPVAGQTIRAEAGTLAIYAGGTQQAFARALPVLELMGDPEQILHLGPSGSGYAVKLLLNLIWFAHAVATAEALTVGVKAGVDLEALHTALVHSPANSGFLERDVRMVLDHGDYDEGFAMKLVTKDLGLAVDLARDVGVPVELAALVEQIHRRARAAYGDEAGEISAIRLYEDLAGIQLRAGPSPDVGAASRAWPDNESSRCVTVLSRLRRRRANTGASGAGWSERWVGFCLVEPETTLSETRTVASTGWSRSGSTGEDNPGHQVSGLGSRSEIDVSGGRDPKARDDRVRSAPEASAADSPDHHPGRTAGRQRQQQISLPHPGQVRMVKIELDLRSFALEAEAGSAGRRHLAPEVAAGRCQQGITRLPLTAGQSLELAELLEGVNPDLLVGADRQPYPGVAVAQSG